MRCTAELIDNEGQILQSVPCTPGEDLFFGPFDKDVHVIEVRIRTRDHSQTLRYPLVGKTITRKRTKVFRCPRRFALSSE